MLFVVSCFVLFVAVGYFYVLFACVVRWLWFVVCYVLCVVRCLFDVFVCLLCCVLWLFAFCR